MNLNDFGSLQLGVLEMLWERGEGTAGDLWEAWPGDRPAYTTVLSALQKLHRRKLAARRSKRGRAHVYTPRIDRETFRRKYLADVRRKVFGGSAAGIVAALVDGERIDAEELAEIERLIAGWKGGAK